jgi:hypothetical protein
MSWHQPRWAAEHDTLVHPEVEFAVFQKPEPVGMPVVFRRQRDFTAHRNPAETILTGSEVLQDSTGT